jgi:hypothetical protein
MHQQNEIHQPHPSRLARSAQHSYSARHPLVAAPCQSSPCPRPGKS